MTQKRESKKAALSQPNASASYAQWQKAHARTRSPRIETENLAFRPLRDLAVRLAGEDYLCGEFLSGTPCSASHLVWFVVSGRILIDSGNGPKAVSSGEMALCPALRPEWVRLESKSAKGVWFHLYNAPRWDFLLGLGPCIRKATHLGEIEWLMDHCLAEIATDDVGSSQTALHYTEALAIMLERELSFARKDSGDGAFGKALDSVWSEVAASVGTKWTVPQLAAIASVSTSHLQHLCLKRYGVGPMGVVTRIRMERAMELLLLSDRKLDDIAEEVGYANRYAFSDAFTRHVGRRPSAIRTSAAMEAAG